MIFKNQPFSELVGKTIYKIDIGETKSDITFYTKENKMYKLYHIQECCETVVIEDINGDLNDLLNTEILKASINKNKKDSYIKYAFYNIATIKGYVTLRWYKEKGNYSDMVTFSEVVKL